MVFQILRTLKLVGGSMARVNLEREFSQRGPGPFDAALRYAVNEGWVTADGDHGGRVALTREGRAEERRTCEVSGTIILQIMKSSGEEWPLASAVMAKWHAVEARWMEQFESGIDFLQDEGLLDFRASPSAYSLTRRGKAVAQRKSSEMATQSKAQDARRVGSPSERLQY
jgi:hypothetical protein